MMFLAIWIRDISILALFVHCCTVSMMSSLPVLLFLIVGIYAQFNIPLPFGGIGLKKTDDGKIEITGNQDVNLFGWGGRRNLKLEVGNGTFNVQKEDTALLNGTKFGGENSFEFDKNKGIDVGANLTLADQKAVGGIGREVNFLEGLFAALKKLSKN